MNPNHTGQGAPFDETLPATEPTQDAVCPYCKKQHDSRLACPEYPSAALPSPASAPKAAYNDHGFPALEYNMPASAEAGDWADEAAREVANGVCHETDKTLLLADGSTAYANAARVIAAIIRRHAPQSQSKAEAVGAQKAVEVLEGLKQRWEARRKQLLASGGHSPALEITNVLLELRDEFEFYLNSVANPPQNPPENAKGEPADTRRLNHLIAHMASCRVHITREGIDEAIAFASFQPTPSTREEGRT